MRDGTTPRQPTARSRLGLAVVFLAAAGLWALATTRRSLWLDEFHSLQHARCPDVPSLLDSVRADNHPPAYLLSVQASRALFGESAVALRLPSVIFGLLTLIVLVRFWSGAIPGKGGRSALSSASPRTRS